MLECEEQGESMDDKSDPNVKLKEIKGSKTLDVKFWSCNEYIHNSSGIKRNTDKN